MSVKCSVIDAYKRLWVVLAVCVAMAGCSIGSPDEGVARTTADAVYQAIQQGNIEGALPNFATTRAPEQWQAHLEHVEKQLGKVESFTFKLVEVNTVLSGRYYIIEYLVGYSSGKTAHETLTLFDSVETGDMPLIVSHVISADGYKPLF